MRIAIILRRLLCAIRKSVEIYRYGGFLEANISYCQQPNLLADKVILVTGGSSGIGLSMAQKFVSCGAKVIVTGRYAEKLQNAITLINSENCQCLVWDHSDIGIISDKLEEAKKLFEREIDILVNNAGVPPSKFWGNVDETQWNRIFNTNLKGNYFLTQELVRQWKQHPFNGYKKILNISSQGGFVGATYPYRMTKWDLRGLTEGLGKSLIQDQIIVNGIAPGVVKTAMQDFALHQGSNLYTDQNPIHRICLPEEIAELAAFMVSDTCNFIIGQTIVCDGGYTLS